MITSVFFRLTLFSFFQDVFGFRLISSSGSTKSGIPKFSNDTLPAALRWGIFIDGRDAAKGPDGYGAKFTAEMQVALAKVYQAVDEFAAAEPSGQSQESKQSPEKTRDFLLHLIEDIRIMLGGPMPWRKFGNFAVFEYKKCANPSWLPKEYVASIEANLEFGLLAESMGSDRVSAAGHVPIAYNYQPVLRSLVGEYVEKVQALNLNTATTPEMLAPLGKLLQNLAFLHPFADGNGRLRLLLLQAELRRLGVAAGTFLWNNNKDVYFENLRIFTAKIEEGIAMYERAVELKENPWVSGGVRAAHERVFRSTKYYGDDVYDNIQKCWDEQLKRDREEKGAKYAVGRKGMSPV